MKHSSNATLKAGSALFIDRDGVINRLRENDYVKKISEFELLPEVIPALEILSRKFRYLFVVTNQQGIGKGLMTDSIETIHNHFLQLLPEPLRPHRIYHCPHLKTEGCVCRKPMPGMALMAKNDFPEIQLGDSFMIGDSESDMEFGRNAGMQVLQIVHPGKKPFSEPYFGNLLEAAQYLDKF